MTPDATLEAIVEAARKRWPEAARISIVQPNIYANNRSNRYTHDKYRLNLWHFKSGKFHEAGPEADSLPALLAKLKGEEDAT